MWVGESTSWTARRTLPAKSISKRSELDPMMRFARALTTTIMALALALPVSGSAQAVDPSTRLRAVLPVAVAERVLARIAEARSQGLPAAALEQRALRFAARGVAPTDIERSVNEHAQRLRAS